MVQQYVGMSGVKDVISRRGLSPATDAMNELGILLHPRRDEPELVLARSLRKIASVYIQMWSRVTRLNNVHIDATGRCTFSLAQSIDAAESYGVFSNVERPPPRCPQLDLAAADTLLIDRHIDTGRYLYSCHSCSSPFE